MPSIRGTSGSNVISGNGRATSLNGLAGNDLIMGYGVSYNATTGVFTDTHQNFAELLSGNNGDDILFGGGGNDSIIGGGGIDTAIFNPTADNISFQWVSGSLIVRSADGVDSVSGVEKLIFSDKTYDINGAVARSDTYSGTENQNLSMNVLANDSSLKLGATLAIQKAAGGTAVAGDVVGTTADGKIAVTYGADGLLHFNPGTAYDSLNAGQAYQTTFTYRISNGTAFTDTATVTLNVTGQNDAPVAQDMTASTTENASVSALFMADDADANKDQTSLTYTIVAQPATGGSVTLSGPSNNGFTFNPGTAYDGLAKDEHATVTFTYKASDGFLNSEVKTVSVDITGVNDAPVAHDMSLTTGENAPLAFIPFDADDVDSDRNQGNLTYTFVTQPEHGIVAISSSTPSNPTEGSGAPAAPPHATVFPNEFTFAPGTAFDYLAQGQSTDVSFTYKASDGFLDSEVKTVSIHVTGVNDAPTISLADPAPVNVVEDDATQSTSVALLNIHDVDDGAVLSYVTSAGSGWTATTDTTRFVQEGTYGTATLDTAAHKIDYVLNNADPDTDTLNTGDHRTDTFHVDVTDQTATTGLDVSFGVDGHTEAVNESLTPTVTGYAVQETYAPGSRNDYDLHYDQGPYPDEHHHYDFNDGSYVYQSDTVVAFQMFHNYIDNRVIVDTFYDSTSGLILTRTQIYDNFLSANTTIVGVAEFAVSSTAPAQSAVLSFDSIYDGGNAAQSDSTGGGSFYGVPTSIDVYAFVDDGIIDTSALTQGVKVGTYSVTGDPPSNNHYDVNLDVAALNTVLSSMSSADHLAFGLHDTLADTTSGLPTITNGYSEDYVYHEQDIGAASIHLDLFYA